MLVGAYQLAHTRIPSHAALNETVNACRRLRKPWATGLVNAVLREIARDRSSIPTDRLFELPEWVWGRLERTAGEQAGTVAQALLERAPMSLRVNLARISPSAYAAKLEAHGLSWQPGPIPENLVLDQPLARRDLPGYDAGEVSIQDSGAQFAAHLLGQAAPARILDACAAPGGKLFHLCEHFPDAEILGLEQSPRRFDHLSAERDRLGHHAALICADARDLSWWDGLPFDAVLLDAPCSGTGTLRRHPDIKHLRGPSDLPAYVRLQGELLRNLWRVLAPGGNLLYCTCSLFEEENDKVVFQFLAETNDAVSLPLEAPAGQSTAHGWQLLPGLVHGFRPDGFYYSRLGKTAAGKSARA